MKEFTIPSTGDELYLVTSPESACRYYLHADNLASAVEAFRQWAAKMPPLKTATVSGCDGRHTFELPTAIGGYPECVVCTHEGLPCCHCGGGAWKEGTGPKVAAAATRELPADCIDVCDSCGVAFGPSAPCWCGSMGGWEPRKW